MIREIRKTVTFHQGSLTIQNVPHRQDIIPTSSGKFVEECMAGSVSLKVSAIAEYMEKKSLSLFDYDDYENHPEIDQIIQNAFNP